MKKISTILLAMLVSVNFFAYDFKYGDLYYNITNGTLAPYTVEVTYEVVDMSTPSDNYPTLTEVVIPATVTHEGNTYHVTAIGEEAFMFCGNLKSVHMPDSIREIKNYAFSTCTSLKEVVMGKGTKTIGANAFNTCLAMTEISLPLSLKEVGVAAFDNCDNITDIYSYAQEVPVLGDVAFRSCLGATVHVPCDMKDLYAADEEWSKFGTIDCFAYDFKYGDLYYNITNDTLAPYTVEVTYEVVDMSTPSDNYPTLTEVVIPATVTHEGNTYHVTAIGEEAFMFCGNLKSVHMPNSILEIKNYAFSACTSLKKVVMGKYTKTIGANAFNTCLAMTEVVLPLSLSKVEVAAFDNCDNITDIYSLAQDVPILGDLAFRSCYGATVHVPCDMEYFYATDEEWSKFDTIVCIAADSAEASAVIVAPTTNSVSITWPAQENAHSYTLEIAKNDTVHCSLFFNEDGKVSHVSYAPARNGHAPARYNVESEDAFQITILGLTPNTLYAYTINSRSEIEGEDTLIDEGTFLTLGGTSTDLENTMLNNHNDKFILNGAIVIRHNGKTYSIMGQELK